MYRKEQGTTFLQDLFPHEKLKTWQMLQLVPQDSVSQAMYSSRGLVWSYLHHHSLKKLEGIRHGSWILEIDTVDDAHKHGEAMCHIFNIVKHNGLLHHNCHIRDLMWNGTQFTTFTAYQEAKLQPYMASSRVSIWALMKRKKIIRPFLCASTQCHYSKVYKYCKLFDGTKKLQIEFFLTKEKI